MDIRNRKAVRAAASEALAANSGDPKKLVLTYTALSAAAILVAAALTMVLSDQIADLGGLSNMGMRSILSTSQEVLLLALPLVLLGLRWGYQSAVLRIVRRQAVQPRDLKIGLHHFSPLLSSAMLRGGLYVLMAFLAAFIAFYASIFTPFGKDYRELIIPIMQDPNALETVFSDQALFEQVAAATDSMTPLFLPLLAVAFLGCSAPFFCQYRLADYCILDTPRISATAAMRASTRMTQRKRGDLLKLDLSFWWFHLVQAAGAVVIFYCFLLLALGLPTDAALRIFGYITLAVAAVGALYVFFLNRVEAARATVYESLRPAEQPKQGGVVLGNIFDLAKEYQED